MRNSILAAIAVAGMLHAHPAAASAWTPPNNVRIVQQTGSASTNVVIAPAGTDVHTIIQNAINAVGPTCSAAGPCTVKLMPGIYDLGNSTLAMRSFVDLVGSGQDNTILVSSAFTRARGLARLAR